MSTNDLHSLGVHFPNQAALESTGPEFIREHLFEAQSRTWKVLHEVRAQIRTGMTEDEARVLALTLFERHGVRKHWHRPYIRFGPGTCLSYRDPLQKDYRLKEGDPLYLDLGPVWTDPSTGIEYEGDVGDSFVMGKNEEAQACATLARDLFQRAKEAWRLQKLSGSEIYQWLKSEAESHSFILVEAADGHRIGDFPHQRFSKEKLSKISFSPQPALWILEVQLNHPRLPFGCFFEDLLNQDDRGLVGNQC